MALVKSSQTVNDESTKEGALAWVESRKARLGIQVEQRVYKVGVASRDEYRYRLVGSNHVFESASESL